MGRANTTSKILFSLSGVVLSVLVHLVASRDDQIERSINSLENETKAIRQITVDRGIQIENIRTLGQVQAELLKWAVDTAKDHEARIRLLERRR